MKIMINDKLSLAEDLRQMFSGFSRVLWVFDIEFGLNITYGLFVNRVMLGQASSL